MCTAVDFPRTELIESQHRTGCVVAVVRKVTGWELPAILDEYRNFAGAKARDCDVTYITALELSDLSNLFAERSAGQFRARAFARISIMTFVAMLIWLFSGLGWPTKKFLSQAASRSRS